MSPFRSLNTKIQSATFDQLADLERAVTNDRKLSATERTVLAKGIANRREYLGKAASA